MFTVTTPSSLTSESTTTCFSLAADLGVAGRCCGQPPTCSVEPFSRQSVACVGNEAHKTRTEWRGAGFTGARVCPGRHPGAASLGHSLSGRAGLEVPYLARFRHTASRWPPCRAPPGEWRVRIMSSPSHRLARGRVRSPRRHGLPDVLGRTLKATGPPAGLGRKQAAQGWGQLAGRASFVRARRRRG